MLVGFGNLEEVLERLSKEKTLSLDTETTSLKPYHGGCLFSLIIGNADTQYYFNFQPYLGLDPKYVLTYETLEKIQTVLFDDPAKTFFMHNAGFDLSFLYVHSMEIKGTVHCTKAIERVLYNDHLKYSLKACGERIGEHKSEAVEEFIVKHKLWAWKSIPGKKNREKTKFFSRVPLAVIQPYAEKDAQVCFRLGRHQEKALREIDENSENLPLVSAASENEKRLSKTIHRMVRLGAQIDREYCVRAARFETDRAEKAAGTFQTLTGETYSPSPLLFARVFEPLKAQWEYGEKTATGKINPSFESDVLKKFDSDIARSVLTLRDAKSKSDFYHGFLYHADSHDRVHTDLLQDGTVTGRLSSRNPNLNNLTDEEDMTSEFKVRRAFTPPDGFHIVSLDQSQVEYRLMLEYAARLKGYETPLIREIKSGKDVHAATADLASITRKEAKTTNFLTLYGGGDGKLADNLGITLQEARRIKAAIFQAAPEIRDYCNQVIQTAEVRGYIVGWLGRRWHFPNKRFCYKAPNAHCQGNAADVMKVALNRMDEYLLDKKSKLVLVIHDEVIAYVHDSEMQTVPKALQAILDSVFPARYLPLTSNISSSSKSLADLE